ncbi:MAG: hypothetical protein H7326_11660, partial [Bdellovibrionaceae bacterium]|nr:hypothetical protein [Pseudobdellovibrionaceae bacterium]
LSASQRQKIQSLKVAAGEFDGAQYPRFKTTEGAQLRSFVETNLKAELLGDFKFGDSRRELNYLRVSGVLYDFLNDHPETPLKPDILYWLSFCETQNRYQNFYSLPEMYLKQCVTEYPQNPIAAKCLKEYQDLITFAYSGSSGTHIPAEVTKELKSLQELVRKVPAR